MRLVLVLVLAACGSPSAPQPDPHEAGGSAGSAGSAHGPVHTADAADARYIGVITAAESVDIAPRIQGVVATIEVRAGDTVTAGQVIAEMDPKSMQEELRAAEAALGAAVAARHQADVDVEDARRKLAVETKAVAAGVSPQVNLVEAELAGDAGELRPGLAAWVR
jgi:multidrug efflux pump subunit AcrA (membrane-fusion protein)